MKIVKPNMTEKILSLSLEKKEFIINFLKEQNATKEHPFVWENYEDCDAPCVIAKCFDDDVNTAFVKNIWLDKGEYIYVSLYAYYLREEKDNVPFNELAEWDDIVCALEIIQVLNETPAEN